jgi:pimeloyl-ACP methyl ester carboxylesterase
MDTPSWRTALQAFPIREVDTDAGVVTFRESGTGDAIVLLHGISSGCGSWVYQLSHFARSARCVAWDAPGYGGSLAIEAASPTAADYAHRLQLFLDALQIQQALVVGHSLGALMAAAFAAQHADRVRAMVLLNPAIGYGAAPPETAKRKLSARLEQLAAVGVEGLAETRAQVLVSPHAPSDAVELIRWNMRRLVPSGYVQAARMLAYGNLLNDAASYAGSVLVASGTEDSITPPDACRGVAEAFPQARYCALPGLGHASYLEDPVLVNRHLDDFRRTMAHG